MSDAVRPASAGVPASKRLAVVLMVLAVAATDLHAQAKTQTPLIANVRRADAANADAISRPNPDRPKGNRDITAPLIGAAAVIAIGALLMRERSATSAPQDQVVDQLLRNGPDFGDRFNMSAFAVRGFVRGGWPVLVDFEQRSPGNAQLRISARGLADVYSYDLTQMCPPPRRCLIQFRLPAEVFGDELRPAVIAATATDDSGKATLPTFFVYALGAGPRAIGSVAVDQVAFGPSTIRVANQQAAIYRFFSHSDFSHASVEFWRVQQNDDGSRLTFVDDQLIDGGVHRDQWVGMKELRQWDGLEKDRKISTGPHKIQVRAWDRVGDWVTAWSDAAVTVAK